MADPILFVTGIGRCGTTMLMRMLDHGGMPVAGPRPAYEVDQMLPQRVDTAWLDGQGGKVVKWIDPTQAPIRFNRLTRREFVFIHMRRDPEHQARSVLKMVGIPATKGNVAEVASSIRRDTQSIDRLLEMFGTAYSATFEWALREPAELAAKLAAICEAHFGLKLDKAAAAAAVIRRTPYCAPDMAIEATLLAAEKSNA